MKKPAQLKWGIWDWWYGDNHDGIGGGQEG
ncbi:hypothetical protein FHS99_000905 [Sphingomonas prati]|uniref:Uncharacterized protein n=1 Tax=Sphingomonas prati TaxID=1843237 RepID=A0A7W9F2F6_9SPHN|nr:hypothetical protein [Sphingomonas prati]